MQQRHSAINSRVMVKKGTAAASAADLLVSIVVSIPAKIHYICSDKGYHREWKGKVI